MSFRYKMQCLGDLSHTRICKNYELFIKMDISQTLKNNSPIKDFPNNITIWH